jgi:glycosyltransferase involved in cell wall biosynthesis
MKSSVQISVIIPVFNTEKYIGRCIRSLLKQTISESEYEIIVINDFSNDNTEHALKPFMGDLRYFKNESRKGLPSSINRGIKEARGQFIVRVDSDDYVHWDYLKILSMFLTLNNSYQAVACDYILVDDQQNVISQENCQINPIGCGIMFRLDKLIEIGLYNEDFLAREDEEFSKRFKKKYNIERVALPLYRYRRHEDNLTNDKKNMEFYSNKLNKNEK